MERIVYSKTQDFLTESDVLINREGVVQLSLTDAIGKREHLYAVRFDFPHLKG